MIDSVRLRAVASSVREFGPDVELPYVALEHVESGTGKLLPGFEPELNAAESEIVFRRGDVLFGKLRSYLAKVLAPDSDGCASGEFVVLRPGPGLEARYLYYVCLSRPFLAWAEATSVGTKMPRTDWEALSAFRFKMPSPDRQRAVVDFLDRETARIDAVVQQKRLLLERLHGRRQSVIFYGVSGLLGEDAEVHDPGVPWARAIREPWPGVKIKHVARLGTGHTPSRSRLDLWEDCTIPWITTGEIQQVRDDRAEVITETREKISEIGLANSAAVLHPAGTVVLCRTASAGFSAIMGTDMATSQDFATWTCSDRLLSRYLLMCLRAMRRDLLGRLAFGSTHKTIYMPDIENLKIPLPTVAEQERVLTDIDSRLERIDALTDRLVGQLTLFAEHRQALITAAVTGQLRVGAEAA